MSAFELITVRTSQTGTELNFVGGFPKLPIEMPLPRCAACGEPLTFFFQVVFPAGHPWAGHALAMFACTVTWHVDHLIPELLAPLKNLDIPDGFLRASQIAFRILVFPAGTAILRKDYVRRVAFAEWQERVLDQEDAITDKVGGVPGWSSEDETPASYAGRPLVFLMQLSGERSFETFPGAPPSASDPELAAFGQREPGTPYDLFVGNVVYLWGTERAGMGVGEVYTLVQEP